MAIQSLNECQRLLFADYLLDNHSSGPDYYDGWTRYDFGEALFAGPQAFRDALAFAKKCVPNTKVSDSRE